MDSSEVKEALCYHDKRNPDSIINEGYEKPKICYCDNCFRGKDKLANEILRLQDKLKGLSNAKI